MDVALVTLPKQRSEICRAILRDLPEWFGRPEMSEEYVAAVAGMPTFACFLDGSPIGFASVSRETSDTVDIHVMGVARAHHRRGIGQALVKACIRHAQGEGAKLLTVRTVGPSSPDPDYARTRAFYQSCGMAAIAEFVDYWGAGTPMLLMGQSVAQGTDI